MSPFAQRRNYLTPSDLCVYHVFAAGMNRAINLSMIAIMNAVLNQHFLLRRRQTILYWLRRRHGIVIYRLCMRLEPSGTFLRCSILKVYWLAAITQNTIQNIGSNDVASVTGQTSLQAVHELLTKRVAGNNVRIYEAGGGSASFIQPNILKGANVTVLDIDALQLQKNSYADKKIQGDVQTYAFPQDSFELIVCYNVIEHLEAPDRAIVLFFQALAPGGLLFIGAPNPNSFSGFITRLTPHWFHVWYYKFILGNKFAGQPGNVPFRTVYHPVVSPQTLIKYCEKLGFRVYIFQRISGGSIETAYGTAATSWQVTECGRRRRECSDPLEKRPKKWRLSYIVGKTNHFRR